MSLPPRIPKKPKRASRWRSQAHCNFIRSHGCCVIGCTGRPIEVAHVRLGSGAGMGQKPDDWNTVSLCQEHHAMQHRMGEQSFWHSGNVSISHPDTLISAFCKRSPKAREIEAVKRERGL